MSRMLRAALVFLCASCASGQAPETFIEKPYLQLGDSPKLQKRETLVLLWHTSDNAADWTVQVHTAKAKAWEAMQPPTFQTVDAPGIEKHRVWRVKLTGLTPGEDFEYRVLAAGKVVFDATGKPRKSASQPVRFALMGDAAQNTPGQRAIAWRIALAKPDFLFFAGDIVYTAGRISEYRDKYFPVYNPDVASEATGAPLIRNVPTIAAPGNHDTLLSNFTRFPDALAYYLYWDQPLNGPAATPGAPKTAHVLIGNEDAQPAFRAAASPRYPTMANFSFDYGNAHWTVLDSNSYMDWSDAGLRKWLIDDLASASGATWRFVAFHHPGFNSSRQHFTDQWMRQLSPIFENAKVDVVFAGHVHNYQRSFPLTFTPQGELSAKGELAGEWKLDKEFADGAARKPKGVVYIVSGGGGASLYDVPQMNEPASWQAFTDKFISDTHSFSLVDIDGKTFQLQQISESGKVIDAFRIAK